MAAWLWGEAISEINSEECYPAKSSIAIQRKSQSPDLWIEFPNLWVRTELLISLDFSDYSELLREDNIKATTKKKYHFNALCGENRLKILCMKNHVCPAYS